MPTTGFGTCHLNDAETFYKAITQAGYRLLDTAAMYKNEENVGHAINRAVTEGGVAREDLFVITKLWMDMFKDPEAACRASMAKLQVEYLDCYMIHWPAGYF